MNSIIFVLILIIIIIVLALLYVYYLIDYTSYIDFANISNISYPPKRTAILLSGQIRKGYMGCLWSQIINIIYPLNADVFFCFDNGTPAIDKKNIVDLLKPKGHIWCDLDNVKDNGLIERNLEYMYSRIYKCNKLKEEYEYNNGFKYDIVIRSRPDLIIKEKIPLKIIKNIDKNTIYVPSVNKYDVLTSNRFIGTVDQFALGDSDSMNIYADVYNFIYPTYINLLKNKQVICPTSESILNYYFKTKNLRLIFYYQSFILYDKRLNNNMLNAISGFFKKHKYYPMMNCYLQNNDLL